MSKTFLFQAVQLIQTDFVYKQLIVKNSFMINNSV